MFFQKSFSAFFSCVLLTICAVSFSFAETYSPFQRDAYMTSSFGENRGTRYHAGFDYSTEMEEGWVIYAPENGTVKELRVSPFGYGKVMFFQGESGKTWVFAHQSSFGSLDTLIEQKQISSKKNDVTIKPNVEFKKGDTLTFSGSSGIGNPHLHLEVRLDNDIVTNPGLSEVFVKDTMAPQIFGVAVWQGNQLAVTSESAFSQGCAVTPVKNEYSLNMAVKIADYSREPKSNPMAIRNLELWRYDEKIYSKSLDTLNFKTMINIRDELLWAEEADTAGDWHFINAKLAPLSTYKLIIEDFVGNKTSREFTFHQECKDNSPIPQKNVQIAPVHTFLSRTMLDLGKCKDGYSFAAIGKKGEKLSQNLCTEFENKSLPLGLVVEKYPKLQHINYSTADSTQSQNNQIAVHTFKYGPNVNWNTQVDGVNVSITIPKTGSYADTTVQTLAVVRTHTDSLDFFEVHPKGLQFHGNQKTCLEDKNNLAPLYWLGETSRNWFIFSKQTKGKGRCASTNELRDIASIDNQESIALGFPYWDAMMIGGARQPALKIPLMFKYDGVEDGNAITVLAGKKWIAAEYDSEPREIIIEGEKLPDAGETITLQIKDEAGRKLSYNIVIPEM